jgi:hypothetical protein
MLTTALNTTPVLSNKVAPAPHAPFDQFEAITGHIGLVASEFTYERDEEIFGEDELAEYVYQVVSGAVRTYKLLSSCSRMDADKLARSTYPAIFSDSSRDRPTAWRPKPSSTRPSAR